MPYRTLWSLLIKTGYLISFLLAFLLLAGQRPLFAASPDFWILVDTREMTLSVMQGDEVWRRYENVAIGRGGTTAGKRRNDDKTPLGEFHIVRTVTDTPFHRFFGLDYPSLQHADRALEDQRISQGEYDSIRKALRAQRIPPQDTPVGGYIGIHGIGQGDPAIHGSFHWTNGCIALTNEQVDDLYQWIRPRMRVIVR